MSMTRRRFTFPTVTLVLSLCALGLSLWPGSSDTWELQRAALARGELWRIWTGHLTHFGASHLGWDLAVFVIVGAILECGPTPNHRTNRKRLAGLLTVSAAVISIGVLVFAPQFERYRGLSGIDSALFAAWLTRTLQWAWRQRDGRLLLLGGAGLVGFCLKCAYEVFTQDAVFVSSLALDFQPVPIAHLLGAGVGALWGWNLSAVAPAPRAAH